MLWLPAWYPNELDPFNGDFLQRHARATSIYCRVHVLYVVRDVEGKITKNVKTVKSVSGNLQETIIYYHANSILPGIASRIWSGIKYLRLYKKVIRDYIFEHGKPQLAHVHIADKNGLVALWLKRKYQIPFLVSEQWTLFLNEAIPQFQSKPSWFKKMWKRVIEESDGVSTVSHYLGKALEQYQNPVPYRVIPNVVDHQVFFPGEGQTASTPVFMHISMLNYQKNFDDILKAFVNVKTAGYAFSLSVFGPVTDALRQRINDAGLSHEIKLQGEVPQATLAGHLRQATALVHYSRYETFGCVITEAHACGIPVIASDIPVHHETIQEGINGFFAENENPVALSEKIIHFLQQGQPISKNDLHETTKKLYGYDVVGKAFYDWYQSVTR